ncbi:cupin domain-containing protein [Candidatus Clostridium stratigraminis]|uniref:Cupin domain-containing protein n=1 Tax=Candidatus Clostridium stratigraminis TaxID=3381661 RepID=A0ABW8T2G0_9CLOT
MYSYYNNCPCSYCRNGTYQCPYLCDELIYNQDFSRQYNNQYFPYEDKVNYDSIFDYSRTAEGNDPVRLKDYGPEPFVVNIDEATKRNNNYRTTLWTGKHLQLTLMSIKPGEDIGLEIHPTVDQFLRVEDGEGLAQMGSNKNNLNYQRKVYDGFAIFIPAGTWHNVINTGNKPLKMYSIYAPPQHPHGTVHVTKAMAH